MATSSASIDIPLKEKYDVFLSFRGPDTRENFISHLFQALLDKKIETFIDDNLEQGEEIAPALLKAIERSLISVIVFSENYASSRWCLDELVHILECRKKYGRHVIPIFYKTVVSDIRHQIGSYELEECFKDRTESERRKWKVALTRAADLSGFESKKTRNDFDLIQQVVQFISMKLGYEYSSYGLSCLVGIERRVQKIESLLCIVPQDDCVRFLVIWGMGGIGKTTLADAVFHRLSSQFDACCFLADVREGSGSQKELKDLRNKLVRRLLGDKNLDLESKTIDPSTAAKLSRRKVLVVLDDVDKFSQLEMFAGPDVTFGSGSRIMLTTRDMQRVREIEVLRRGGNHDVKMYEVEKLNTDEARQLFNLNASTGIYSGVDSTNLSTSMLASAAGCPLALKIWSSLSHKHSWDEITKNLNEDMGSIYRVSYDVLKKNEKEIFLDIACFLKGKSIDDVRRHLDCCGRLYVNSGIDVLICRSLIELRDNDLWMHDVIQEMGREIVKEESPKEPGNHSRLYTLEDISHVLRNDTGTATVESMFIPNFTGTEVQMPLTPQVFGKMRNLTYLKIDWHSELELPQGLEYLPEVLRYLSWQLYPYGTLPSKFFPRSLIELHMFNSKLQTLWNTDQKPRRLKHIDLSHSRELVDVSNLTESKCLEIMNFERCESLVQVPNLSKCLNIASINLEGCTKLVEIPSYFENFHKLTVLNLRDCWLLKCIPEMPSNLEYLLIGELYGPRMELSGLPSSICSLQKLVVLDLEGCYQIETLPRSIWMLNSLTYLNLSGTSLDSLPSSIECLSKVVSIELQGCHNLVSLSDSIDKLKFLISLDLSECSSLVSLPTSIYKLKSLEELDLSGCSSFKLFPEILEPMESLKTLRLSETKIEELHESIENLVGLEELDLSECMIRSIPTSIKELSGLTSLYIFKCEQLESLPKLPFNLKYLDADGCGNLEMVSFSMTAVTQGLDQICDKDLHEEKYSFRSCTKLSETAKSNMVVDAQLRIMRMAAAFLKREQINPALSYWTHEYSVAIAYPGNEVPEWFDYREEGSSIKIIKFPLHPSQTKTNFWQLVLCAVFTVNEDEDEDEEEENLLIWCYSKFTKNNVDCSPFVIVFPCPRVGPYYKIQMDWVDKSQVIVCYCAHWSYLVRNASEGEASFEFSLLPRVNHIKVKKCGVALLPYEAQDVKLVNQDLGEPKPEQVISTKRSRDEYEASGSATVAFSDLFH